MNIKISLKQQAIRALSKAQADAMSMTAMEIHSETVDEQKMPFKEGILQNESVSVDDSEAALGKVSLIADTPYARRLYFNPEYDFNQELNSSAGAGWWDSWVSGSDKDRLRLIYGKLFKKLSGRYVK